MAQPGRPAANALDPYWMPFTANRRFKAAPRLMVSAKDMHYTDADGRRILDGTSGLWCVNAGHCREPITRAIAEQAARIDYAPAFQGGHPGAFELAGRLAALMPGDLDHVFLGNSGSEAVDTAIKIALAHAHQRGEPQRRRIITRELDYHGAGIGGTAAGGLVNNRRQFGTLLDGIDFMRHTYDAEKMAFTRGQPSWGADMAEDLEALIERHGAETIAAVIVEPVAGSAGVLVPPAAYLERLRTICDTHGLLLIFDEVITGFGRLGAGFAADYFGIVPDMICMAKGLTNATVPMGAVAVRKHIYDAFMDAPDGAIELYHGYTYSGHPLACAAALATLDLYRDEDLFARGADLSRYWEDALHGLRDKPHVVDIRNLGLMGAIQLDPGADGTGVRAYEAYLRCFERGLLVRQTGDVIAMSPALIAQRTQIDEMVTTVGDVFGSLG